MTAYSFGNRWVGIVALGTPPPPEPLHKMALRLRQKSVSRRVRIKKDLTVPVDPLLSSLAQIRLRMAVSGREVRSQECLIIERSIRSGRRPAFRPWLQEELVRIHGHERAGKARGGKDRKRRAETAQASSSTVPTVQILSTKWATSYPQAPDSAWLPPAPPLLVDDLRKLELDLDEGAMRWVRWSCLHSSYLYESVPDSPISAEALEVLASLGQCWMRMALLERIRTQRGDFVSSADASGALATDKQVRSALGMWVNAGRSGFYGKGEAGLLAAGAKSTAPEKVALQILGALSLVTASQSAADGLLELIAFQPTAPEPDWMTLLCTLLKREPKLSCTDTGSDHNKVFTVTVQANGLSTSAGAGSIKAARRLAARSYILQHMPYAVPAPPPSRTAKAPRPLPYRLKLPQHAQARGWAQQAFEVADAGLMSQALTHRSWIHENRNLVSQAHQHDYGTLATEGSEALTTLIRHHHALHTFESSFQVPASAVTRPSVPREVVAELFDRMPVAEGILRAAGTPLSLDIKEDVTQAIIGAAWRANGDLLMERQPETLAVWVQSFTPPPDPATQLQNYCAGVKVRYSVDFERRGPDHRAEYRATINFEIDQRPQWRGDWCSGTTQAKQSAAGDALRCLFGEVDAPSADSVGAGYTLLRAMLLAELRTVDLDHINARKELASGKLGVDLLATGVYSDFERWAVVRSVLLPVSDSAVVTQLTDFYEAVLKQQRRDAVRHWIVRHLPSSGIDGDDTAQCIRSWREGESSGRLALLEDLLTAVPSPDPANAILEYIELQAMFVAEAAALPLESARGDDAKSRVLTLRLPGGELSDALEPVTEIVESVVGGVTWDREPQAVSVTIRDAPDLADPVFCAGMEGIRRARQDPWLQRVRDALADFLAFADRLMKGTPEATPAQLDEFVSAQLALVTQLRTRG